MYVASGITSTTFVTGISHRANSKGFDTILVVVDKFTKKSYFLPTNSMVMSKGIAILYQDQIFVEHRLPEKVISD